MSNDKLRKRTDKPELCPNHKSPWGTVCDCEWAVEDCTDDGKNFRESFRNDNECIEHLEACNTSLQLRVTRLEIQLKITERLIDELGGARGSHRKRVEAEILCNTD